ncbi:hypothetical protein RZS08_53860, partial [Arthrospira platensis SPKY1]|nr:hypothetical protein [Arthrospira platensis SPKY1]
LEIPHTYSVQIQSQNGFSSSSPDASSTYLDIISGDESNTLTWQSEVPWNNVLFEIFRQDNNGDFIKTGETDENFWQDTGLQNGLSYCYKILAKGSYAIDNIEDPLLNYS